MSTIATVWDNPSAKDVSIRDLEYCEPCEAPSHVLVHKKYSFAQKCAQILATPFTMLGFALLGAVRCFVVYWVRIMPLYMRSCSSTAQNAIQRACREATLGDLKSWLADSPDHIVNAIKRIPLWRLRFGTISNVYVQHGGSLLTAVPPAFTEGMNIVEDEMRELLETGRVKSKEHKVDRPLDYVLMLATHCTFFVFVSMLLHAVSGAIEAWNSTQHTLCDLYDEKTTFRRVKDFTERWERIPLTLD